jgi:hypothetical protein
MLVREMSNTTAPQTPDRAGRIVRTYVDGMAILWTYVPELPLEEERLAMPWLTVLSWKYDGTSNSGMPNHETTQLMLGLDQALGSVEQPSQHVEVYRRIGKGLREFVFHVADREAFMEALNRALASHPQYPIEIKFYEDRSWSDLTKLIADFSDA